MSASFVMTASDRRRYSGKWNVNMALYFDRKRYDEKTKSKFKSKAKAKEKAKEKANDKSNAKVPKPTKAKLPVDRDADGAAREVAIKDIVILSNRRKTDEEAVFAIEASMEKLGQLEPIMLRERKKGGNGTGKTSTKLVLVDGHHRIKAARSLGWDTISAVLFHGSKNEARVYELTQNLARAGITVLERAKSLAELVRRVLGESRAKELAQPGGRQPRDKGISKTARALGYTRDDIRRCTAIASMSSEAMAKAEKLDLDDNESALLKIAKKKPNEQVAVAEQLAPKKKGGKKGSKKPKFNKKDEASYKKLVDAWADATEWQEVFREATENARRKFIRMLQGLPLQETSDDDQADDVEDRDEAVEEDEQERDDDEDEDDEEDEED
jgi:ParB family transcriptional regulator, chromosome partitioning protein